MACSPWLPPAVAHSAPHEYSADSLEKAQVGSRKGDDRKKSLSFEVGNGPASSVYSMRPTRKPRRQEPSMKRRHAIATMVTSSLALAASAAGIAQSAPAPGGGLQVLDFKPGFDDFMTMLVQPRHIKLYAAGKAGELGTGRLPTERIARFVRRIGRTPRPIAPIRIGTVASRSPRSSTRNCRSWTRRSKPATRLGSTPPMAS